MSSSQQSKKMQCGYCQAEIAIPPFSSVVTCEFCGTPNELKSGKTFKHHHMLNIYFSGSELTELIPQYLSKFVGVPPDFADKAIFLEFELRMMPFWVFKLHGRTNYNGIGKIVSPSQSRSWRKHIDIDERPERGTIDLDQTCLVFGYSEQHHEIRDEKIPIATKEAFDITAVSSEGGRIYDTEIGYDDAYGIAESQVKARHQELIYREIHKIQSVKQKINLKEVSYLHVPFYRVTYSYGNWKGEALVDASRGKVLRAEYPLSRGHRFWGFILLLGSLIAIGALIVLALYIHWVVAGIAGGIIFFCLIIFGLKEMVTGRKVAAE